MKRSLSAATLAVWLACAQHATVTDLPSAVEIQMPKQGFPVSINIPQASLDTFIDQTGKLALALKSDDDEKSIAGLFSIRNRTFTLEYHDQIGARQIPQIMSQCQIRGYFKTEYFNRKGAVAKRRLTERRCGWLDNPTPNNWWLTDHQGEWELSIQGGPQAHGFDSMPQMSTKGWVVTNAGGYGYGCACMTVETDHDTQRITRIHSAKPLPLRRCLADPRLPKMRPEPLEFQ